MTDQRERQPGQARRRSKGLLKATSVFGVLYLIFIIISFIPAPEGSPVSGTVPFDPFDMDQIFVKLLFLLFVLGYVLVWKNEGIGGVIFILWWVTMACKEIGASWATPGPTNGGGGMVMGFPLFVLGILFVVGWYKK